MSQLLRAAMENGEEGGGGGEYTKDGSVDLRGNPVLRSKRGGWTACTFIFRRQRDSESASGTLSFLWPTGRRQCFAAGICFACPWAMDL